MLESILAQVDAEIARLQSAKVLLSSVAIPATRKRGGPANLRAETLAAAKSRKRRTISAEARERMRQAQIKRWAAAKKSPKANMNTVVSPLPAAKKRAPKAA